MQALVGLSGFLLQRVCCLENMAWMSLRQHCMESVPSLCRLLGNRLFLWSASVTSGEPIVGPALVALLMPGQNESADPSSHQTSIPKPALPP